MSLSVRQPGARRPRVLLFGDERSPHVHKWVGYLEESGAEVDVIGYGEGRAPDAFAYRSLAARGEAASGLAGKLRCWLADLRLLRSRSYDAAWFHFLSDRYAAYVLASRMPAIVTCWGSDVLVELAKARGLSLAVRSAALRKAARITADSEDVLAEIERAAPGTNSRSSLVYWGVDTRRFGPSAPDAANLRAELGIPEGAVVLLSNRLCAPHYRIDAIIERFVRAVRAADIHLVVRAQPGCDRDYLARCKGLAGAGSAVRFLERPLADAELPALYRSADIALHYPKTDATPVSMLEALASGLAVACSDEVPSYERLAADYRLTRAPLSALDEALVRRVAAERAGYAVRNRETLVRLHSRDRSVADVGEALRAALGRRRDAAGPDPSRRTHA